MGCHIHAKGLGKKKKKKAADTPLLARFSKESLYLGW